MKRCLPFVLVALLFASLAYGSPITPEEALARLAGGAGAKRIGRFVPSLVHTVKTKSGRPAVYVMSQAKDGGYIFLSADDAATPLLGYSDSGSFDAGQMPEAMRWWLGEYARQIEYAASLGVPVYANSKETAEREPIAPLIRTKWDQVAPFNNVCPLSGYERTYTGCVATTMAQVMNYWKYPAQGQGSVTYNAYSINKQLTMSFAKQVFDWDNMLDEYPEGGYTEAEADAVAKLMRACGYSVKMDYSMVSSSALALDIANAMVKYFNYDANAHYAIRDLYSSEQWADMIYENLKNVGPVPYGGISILGGGHSFVCDGYDGDGFFHFNWGWSGKSDGYFRLDALDPEFLGTGGGIGGGYNHSQDAVLGIQPPTGEPAEERLLEIIQFGSLTGSVNGTELVFGLENNDLTYWINYNPTTLNVTFGAIFEPQDCDASEAVAVPIDFSKVTLKAGYATSNMFVPSIDLAKVNLSDGVYKVTFATKIDEENRAEWIPVHPLYGHNNHIILTKSDGEYSATSGIGLISAYIYNRYNSIYDMRGVNVGRSWESLPAGVYLRNGMKILKR